MSKLTAFRSQAPLEILSDVDGIYPPPGGGHLFWEIDSVSPHTSTPAGLTLIYRQGSAGGLLGAVWNEATIVAAAIADMNSHAWTDWYDGPDIGAHVYELRKDDYYHGIESCYRHYWVVSSTGWGYAEVREIQWKFINGPTATNFLKVWLARREGETLLNETVLTLPATMIDKSKSVEADENLYYSAIYHEPVPTTNSIQTLCIDRLSLLETYVPVPDGSYDFEVGYYNGFPPWGVVGATTAEDVSIFSDEWSNT